MNNIYTIWRLPNNDKILVKGEAYPEGVLIETFSSESYEKAFRYYLDHKEWEHQFDLGCGF